MILQFKIEPENWYQDYISDELQFLQVFIENLELQISMSIESFKDGTIREVEETDFPYDGGYNVIREEYLGLDGLSLNLDHRFKTDYPNLQRSSAFITLHGFLEHELVKLCNLLMDKESYKLRFKDIQKNGSDLERSVDYLDKVCGIEISKGNSEWSKLKGIVKIRKTFAHNMGIVEEADQKEFDKIINENEYLLLEKYEKRLILNKGFLEFVLATYWTFLESIDEKIKLKYVKKSD